MIFPRSVSPPAISRSRVSMHNGFFIGLVAISMVLMPGALSAAPQTRGDLPPQIEKTFDYGTLIEHTVSVQKGIHWVSMRLSQRREAKDRPGIVNAHLTFYPDSAPGAPPLSAPIFESLLIDMINALYARFGNDLKLTSLSAGGFLGIDAVEKSAILSMNGYAPWEHYLGSANRVDPPEIYRIIQARWEAADVFLTITNAFDRLGYQATFSGFEKLFVFPAGKCSFYEELEALGIRRGDRFPYPGVVTFRLFPK